LKNAFQKNHAEGGAEAEGEAEGEDTERSSGRGYDGRTSSSQSA
jgi:hypothetical protein